MVDLSEYERRGDLDAPFEVTKTHDRSQKQAEDRDAAVRCDVPGLTWTEFVAGEPCPGCGLPYNDGSGWEFKGTMYFTDDERERYDAEEARYMALHGNCRAHRHHVSGSLTLHCGKCCPSPPFSPAQRHRLARILGADRPKPHELMRWRLRLYCGHVVEKISHHTHKSLGAAFIGSVACPDCGRDPATILDAAAIGLVGPPPGGQARPGTSTAVRKPTRRELEARVKELEADNERLRGLGSTQRAGSTDE